MIGKGSLPKQKPAKSIKSGIKFRPLLWREPNIKLAVITGQFLRSIQPCFGISYVVVEPLCNRFPQSYRWWQSTWKTCYGIAWQALWRRGV
jgi:hypothetical protein